MGKKILIKKGKEKDLNNNKKINDKKSKKFNLQVTSKMKKKIKFTRNKLNIDKLKIKKILSHIIKEEPPIIKKENIYNEGNKEIEEEMKEEGGVPIYLYITLKKDLKEDEIKLIKNKIIKLKYSMINDFIYICLIEDKLSNEEKDKLIQLSNSRIDIITKEDLKNNIKDINKLDLNNQYQIFITDVKNNIHLNKNLDTLYYHSNKFEIISSLINKVINGATIIRIFENKKNIIKIKFGYTNMNNEELLDNVYRTIFKAISFVLTNSEKYNGIENVLIKTQKSIPFSIFGNIQAEKIDNYKF